MPFLLLPFCQALLFSSGFLSFHGSPPTRIFTLKGDVSRGTGDTSARGCLLLLILHSSLGMWARAWLPHPGQHPGPQVFAYQGEGAGLSLISIHLFMSLLIYLCIYCNNFIEIEFTYHKIHPFKVCSLVVLIQSQNCANITTI